LPVVTVRRKPYYFDKRLRQLRSVNDPHRFIDLTEEESADVQFRLDSGLEPEFD
jgi:hypothetical protein